MSNIIFCSWDYFPGLFKYLGLEISNVLKSDLQKVMDLRAP